MSAAMEVTAEVGRAPLCDALGIARASFYRHLVCRLSREKKPRSKPDCALSPGERREVLGVLHTDRFFDKAPTEIYATLLDEGSYLCSIRTMYRILAENREVRERRDQRRHPQYHKPELLATAPNQVWTWDITKLLSVTKWTYYYLYVILDIFSRYVAGWLLAHRESGALAERLIQDTCDKQGIVPGQLTLHGDNGPSMTSKTVALLLGKLGVTKTHSRPYVSNDNPFSESQFKTLKYQPEFPDRFSCFEEAEVFCRRFFTWYNEEHRHTGIGLLTPEMLHYGAAGNVTRKRQHVLDGAYAAHPERFIHRPPITPVVPQAAGINMPRPQIIRGGEILH